MSLPPDLLTFEQARKIAAPIVYGLSGADQKIFYIGATRNPFRRFHQYAKKTANLHLLRQLKKCGEEVKVSVLSYAPEDLAVAEYEMIVKLSPQLTNVSGNPYKIPSSYKAKIFRNDALGVCEGCDGPRDKRNSKWCYTCLGLRVAPARSASF